ncbi:riboflavin synthase alpha chain [Orenia metallireducens]|jgi:riboflavin synthase|uniref:Riboflavin synthase n=1 Tax=Orenia metallireducens TaxID=1413210 RepID=A0A285FFV4_9FIRM|nr:riboflavin synthase [Orenia metallireducens]PRX33524.1 riboflavin synthase alpha chain [Orenia metallireducens]SNY10128.1 riboflavin synthase alpha chain [Orenia metallireducens]
MFTGIVEELGKVKRIQRGSKSIVLVIEAAKVLEDVKLGDSIATNGVCLTVTSFTEKEFTVDVMPETMRHSSLGDLKVGSEVNLERALRLGDRLGGHLVSGHIDGLGTIKSKKREDNATVITIEAPKNILKYIIHKGSIAIDGVSLTVANLDESSFAISLIPHTSQVTLLGQKEIGAKVNLEVDMIGKYVERMLGSKEDKGNKKSDIDLDLLKDNGFLLA